MSILIKNASFIITQNPKRQILKGVDIFVKDSRIAEIGKGVSRRAEHIIQGKKKLVLPGLINSHTHLAMSLFRGMADDLPLAEWLRDHIWPMEMRLTPKHIYYGTLLGCIESIKSGTTCLGDMYFGADEVARAVESSGLKALVSSVVVDLLPESKAGIKVMKKTLRKLKALKSDRVRPWLGPHSAYSCSEETLQKVKEISMGEGVRINIHLAESKSEVDEVVEKHGKKPVEFLDEIGFLSPNLTAVHCVQLTRDEIETLKRTDVKVVHNPCSNMKLASGIAPVPEMLEKGICVALGTDGPASNNRLDIFQEMKVAALLHKVNKLDPTVMPAEKILDIATINGAKALGLEKEIGSLETGKKADIAIMNLDRPHLQPIVSDRSLISHLVYSATGDDVETVIINGEVVMKNRAILTVDESKVLDSVNKLKFTT